jgi:hypothetical protein
VLCGVSSSMVDIIRVAKVRCVVATIPTSFDCEFLCSVTYVAIEY